MRQAVPKLAICACFLLGIARADVIPDRNQSIAKCKSTDPDLRITGCTALIQAKQETSENLALIYNNRGSAYDDKGEYDRSIQDYDVAIRLNPDSATAFYGRGHAHKKKGEEDLAIADFNSAIRLNPTFELAYYDRGNAYMNKDDYARALLDFNKAVELKPDDSNAHNNRAVDYIKMGDYAHAIQDCNEAVRLNPGATHAYVNRGTAFFAESNLTAALSDFEHLLSTAPSSSAAITAAVYLHVIMKQQGRDDSQQLARVTAADLSKWPGAMLKFDRGQWTAGQVMTAAKTTDTQAAKWQSWQVCEANYLIGKEELSHHQTQIASTRFKAAENGCPKGSLYLPLAKAELKKIATSPK